MQQVIVVCGCPQRPAEMNGRLFPLTVTWSKSWAHQPSQSNHKMNHSHLVSLPLKKMRTSVSAKQQDVFAYTSAHLALCSMLSALRYWKEQSNSFEEKDWATKITRRCSFLSFDTRFFNKLLAWNHHYQCQPALKKIMNPQNWILSHPYCSRLGQKNANGTARAQQHCICLSSGCICSQIAFSAIALLLTQTVECVTSTLKRIRVMMHR